MILNDSQVLSMCDFKDDALVCMDDKHFWKLKTVFATEDAAR